MIEMLKYDGDTGRWEVLSFSHMNKRYEDHWNCRCECGTERVVKGRYIRNGRSKSCGCYKKEKAAEQVQTMNTRHGHAGRGKKSPTWRSWVHMRQRCLCPTDRKYPDYGGRGIGVCSEWLESFEAFLRDMGERPPGTTLDRIDNDGNYEPGNCRWATPVEQGRNKRNNRLVKTPFGKMTVAEAAALAGVTRSAMLGRIERGWSPGDILLPSQLRKSKHIAQRPGKAA